MEGSSRPTVHLNRFDEWPAAARCRELAGRAVRTALARGRRKEHSADGRGVPPGSAPEISVTCLSCEEIREMNRHYLSRDRPTDVIAFELGDPPALLGDVYLCPEVAEAEAEERGIDPSREILRLVIHGTLHALGWEHPEGAGREESEMFRLQEHLLEELVGPGGDPSPRGDRAEDRPRGSG